MDKGYVYAPYIISVDTATLDDFSPSILLRSRYAAKQVNSKHYSSSKFPVFLKEKELTYLEKKLDEFDY